MYQQGIPELNAAKSAEEIGYLFGERPLAPGVKRVKEGWENMWVAGMSGGAVILAVGLSLKPDTNLQTAAREEAVRRFKEGTMD